MTVQATIVDEIRSPAGKAAGAIEIRKVRGEVRGLAFRCPCGCGQESYLPVSRTPNEWHWTWDGDESAPTLSPSVFQKGLPCQWHGYLRAGAWVLA